MFLEATLTIATIAAAIGWRMAWMRADYAEVENDGLYRKIVRLETEFGEKEHECFIVTSKHDRLVDRVEEMRKYLAAEMASHGVTKAELIETKAKLAAKIAKHSAAGRAGRQAQLAQAAARRNATTAALQACVEARG